MTSKLSEWYQKFTIGEVSANMLDTRLKAINQLHSRRMPWLFNCIKLYLNKKITDHNFLEDFIKAFTKHDGNFPQNENILELRTLAGAILYSYVNKYKTMNSVVLSIALKCSLFKIDQRLLINTEIIEAVDDFLYEYALEQRNGSREHIKAEIEQIPKIPQLTIDAINNANNLISSSLKKIQSSIDARFKVLLRRVEKVEEEMDIYWWSLSGNSNDLNVPFSELDKTVLPFFIGKELADLIKIFPGPPSSNQILNKMLDESLLGKHFSCRIDEIVTALNGKLSLTNSFTKSNIGNICPLYLGCELQSNQQTQDKWITNFEKLTNIKVDTLANEFELAEQSYYESLLVKTLNI